MRRVLAVLAFAVAALLPFGTNQASAASGCTARAGATNGVVACLYGNYQAGVKCRHLDGGPLLTGRAGMPRSNGVISEATCKSIGFVYRAVYAYVIHL